VSRPRIGISVEVPRRPGFFELRDDYVRSVEAAGGLPLLLAPGRPGDAAELLACLDGLLLTGGCDVDPELYGESAHPKLGRVSRERDLFELALCRQALSGDLPLLAICRGQQVLNVAAGGTLLQDLPSELSGALDHDPDVERWHPAHEVRVEPGSRLREVLREEQVRVNSFHHQAVGRLGDGLVVSARALGDAVVEGIEMPGRRFAVGVQWHPESYWDQGGDFRSLFEALVAEARR
jgi:putative glutamine amidotransferase